MLFTYQKTLNSNNISWCQVSEDQVTYVTGPAKMDQVDTKYTISQNGKYLEFCVQYLPSVNCETLAIKLWFDGENFTSIALADD